MASMAMGGAIGQNMASMMNGMFAGMNQPQAPQQTPSQAPPPPPTPTATYHVVVNGAAAGPYGMQELSQMVVEGQLTQTTLVWKPGMATWAPVSSIPELMGIFNNTIPPIPPQL
mgnify:CR=1 FL=1